MNSITQPSLTPRAQTLRQRSNWPILRSFALLWERPLPAALLALLVYSALALVNHPALFFKASEFAYYNYLADAFLQGQMHLRLYPASVHDLILYQDRYYLYWGPMPAIMLVPFVALFGVQFSDVVFTLFIGAANVALVALVLRQASVRGIARLSRVQRGVLVLFFALGTVHTTLAPNGRVWFTGQLIGFMFVALTYLVALRQSGWSAFMLAGAAITGALLTRNHMLFAGLWPACYLLYQHRKEGWRRLLGYTSIGLLPIVLGLVLIGAYNLLRFGSVADNGLDYHLMGEIFRADYQKYGAFHPYYLPTNLYYQYIAYPFPLNEKTPMGGSLFLLSPVFFAATWGVIKGRRVWHMWGLLASIMLVSVPILLLMGTGYAQFGPRYTLDFHIPLLLITAFGIRRWPMWLLAGLTVISLVHYLIGAVLF